VAGLSEDQQRWVYVVTLFLLGTLLAFVHVAQTGYVVRQTEEMERLESQMLALKQGNNAIRLRIAEYEQWSRLKGKAIGLGFGEPERIEYVDVQVSDMPVATSKQDTSQSGVPFSPVRFEHLPDFWQQLARQFTVWIQGDGFGDGRPDTSILGGVQ
jgi:hypothetical protein